MKIEGTNPVDAQLPLDAIAARVVRSEQVSTQGAAHDWTSFHSDSHSVLALTSQALTSPEVRQGTVDALRESVNSGQYQVDASKIVDAIRNSDE